MEVYSEPKPVLNKLIINEIRQSILAGLEKDVMFDHYKTKENEKELRMLLSTLPNYDLKLRYDLLNKLLSGVWAVLLVLTVLELVVDFAHEFDFDARAFIALLVSLLIFSRILNFNGITYLPGAFWLSLGILNAIKEVIIMSPEQRAEPFVQEFYLLYGVLLVIGIILMLIIRKKVFYYFRWFKPGKDAHGQYRYQ